MLYIDKAGASLDFNHFQNEPKNTFAKSFFMKSISQ